MSISIHNDEPTNTDKLGRETFAKALTEVLSKCETPLVVGLYGSWGVGKTSLMRQIRELIAARDGVKTVWFDAWQHQFDEEPAIALLHTMVAQLELGEGGKKLLTIIASALGSLLLKTTTTLGTTDLQELGERYEEERFQLREKQVRLKSYFTELIRKATNEGNHRVVFFIDDLDRCVPEQVLKVLEALKLYLSLEDCVYVMGVDRLALECSIRQRYRELEIREADYLDKIVQLPFSIPPITRAAMRQFIAPMLHADLRELTDMLVAGLGENPRQVKRFLNTLQLNHALASSMIGHNYEPRTLAAMLLIQLRRPELFKAVVLNPSILEALSEGGDSAAPYADLVGNDMRLMEIIPIAGFTDISKIEKYIYLTEVVAASQSANSGDEVMTAATSAPKLVRFQYRSESGPVLMLPTY